MDACCPVPMKIYIQISEPKRIQFLLAYFTLETTLNIRMMYIVYAHVYVRGDQMRTEEKFKINKSIWPLAQLGLKIDVHQVFLENRFLPMIFTLRKKNREYRYFPFAQQKPCPMLPYRMSMTKSTIEKK